MPVIDPVFWLTIANERQPQSKSVTPWFSGAIAPVHSGYYERHYTDGNYMHYWCGTQWHSQAGCMPHWRQVGDYPAWRGLSRRATPPPAQINPLTPQMRRYLAQGWAKIVTKENQ
jgi:hypothetical protein